MSRTAVRIGVLVDAPQVGQLSPVRRDVPQRLPQACALEAADDGRQAGWAFRMARTRQMGQARIVRDKAHAM